MRDRGLLKELIQNLCCLPGIGPKSAQRMAFHLLQRNREGGMQLGKLLVRTMEEIGYCKDCRTFTEAEQCEICADPNRANDVICIVEHAADVWLLNQATGFNGKYFVLHGRLSPLDGIGPDELGIAQLEHRFEQNNISEVILATNTTIEGQATAHFVAELAAKHHIRATRIAHGVPMGGELEFIDSGTLAHAFKGRHEF
ncbi:MULTISPECIES: recombination mediator RecR [Methylomonas]|uniref:recombination mediator RecR n=1 Tax=Methylomonas TaxID=416 RepID=UPI001231877C|nr:recombination mediator RecR [Methylomonas rhizoryzae]